MTRNAFGGKIISAQTGACTQTAPCRSTARCERSAHTERADVPSLRSTPRVTDSLRPSPGGSTRAPRLKAKRGPQKEFEEEFGFVGLFTNQLAAQIRQCPATACKQPRAFLKEKDGYGVHVVFGDALVRAPPGDTDRTSGGATMWYNCKAAEQT